MRVWGGACNSLRDHNTAWIHAELEACIAEGGLRNRDIGIWNDKFGILGAVSRFNKYGAKNI
jgi:hypothetical protein